MLRTLPAIILLIFSGIVSAQSLNGSAFINYARFQTDNSDPYLEVAVTIDAKALSMYEAENGFMTSAIISILVAEPDRDSVAFETIYELSSPEFDKKNQVATNLIDLRRFAIPNAKVQIDVSIEDKIDSTNRVEFHTTIPPLEDGSVISDLVLVDRLNKSNSPSAFTKHGLDIVPYPFNYYPTGINKLGFYSEAYGLGSVKEEEVYTEYYITEQGSKKRIPRFRKMGRMKAANIIILTDSFDISDLPSGSYDLHIAILNPKLKVLTERTMQFYRLNQALELENMKELAALEYQGSWVDSMPIAEVDKYLPSLIPISLPNEEKLMLELKNSTNLALKKRYFYSFWFTRDPVNSEKLWTKYKAKVDYVNDEYNTTNMMGYETDRGRVYLQYGPPNDWERSAYEPTANPYEIWTYYSLNTGSRIQTNVIFVFLEEQMATNNPELIHSNADGEIQDSKWKQRIYQGVVKPDQKNNLDRFDVPDNYGSGIDDF